MSVVILNKKKNIVSDIQNNANSSKAIIFYKFHGVEEEEIIKLKEDLKKIGAFWKVYKNNLVKKAFPEKDLSCLSQANVAIFCKEDQYKPLRVLAKFNKEFSDKKRFTSGIYKNDIVSSEDLEKWSKLPSKEILLSNLCYYLNFNVTRLVNVLIQKK